MHRRFGAQPLSDVANMPSRKECPSGTSDIAKPTLQLRRSIRSVRSNLHAKSSAVPFPTISEEGTDESTAVGYEHDPSAEEGRGREWAHEIARRQQNIKELRDRKLRLEQTQAARTRKTTPSYSYLTSIERKLTADDLDFIAALHASVVWRLWHVDLTPEVFASERLLATRLHLVLIRHGCQNIPVPPIVALSKSHHLMQSFSTRHMIEKDRPGIQTLPQLVAKSFLRQRKQPRSRSRVGARVPLRKDFPEHPSSPLSKETVSPM